MINDRMIDQAFSDVKGTCGGVRNDYFGLLYLEKECGLPREKAVNQVAFGGNDYGLDGFHFDADRRNLYLYQFKYSPSHALFKGTLQRLIDVGMERIFLSPNKDDAKNQLILQLRSCMVDNRALIDQVCFRFIFTGDPSEAERSQVLDKLREDLENKKYLVDQFFAGRQVTLVVEFRSVDGKVGPVADTRQTRVYDLPLTDLITQPGPAGQVMHIGFIRLVDLGTIHRDMGQRFFERNIRYGLGSSEAVNRAISRALKQIVLDGGDHPAVFAFNHNGITMFAEKVERIDGQYRVTAPRLLNGAQTVTTLSEFLNGNKDNPRLAEGRPALEDLRVMCRIITNSSPDFVTQVTINNNRQNPVGPWNLHANDLIQLELQDKFRSDLGIYYERQEEAFANLSYEEMEEQGITEGKAIELVRLAQTFLVTDGAIDKFYRMREVFEDDKLYSQVFNPSRLKADSRQIVLCYKVHFRLRKLLNEIVDKGPSKYGFVNRARGMVWALLCQGMLNTPDLEYYAEAYGQNMTVPADYTALLSQLATTRVRMILAELIKESAYAAKVAEGSFGFLRTNTAYKRCMEIAYKRWKWVEKRLK
jgi:hypothetical protein